METEDFKDIEYVKDIEYNGIIKITQKRRSQKEKL